MSRLLDELRMALNQSDRLHCRMQIVSRRLVEEAQAEGPQRSGERQAGDFFGLREECRRPGSPRLARGGPAGEKSRPAAVAVRRSRRSRPSARFAIRGPRGAPGTSARRRGGNRLHDARGRTHRAKRLAPAHQRRDASSRGYCTPDDRRCAERVRPGHELHSGPFVVDRRLWADQRRDIAWAETCGEADLVYSAPTDRATAPAGARHGRYVALRMAEVADLPTTHAVADAPKFAAGPHPNHRGSFTFR